MLHSPMDVWEGGGGGGGGTKNKLISFMGLVQSKITYYTISAFSNKPSTPEMYEAI